MEYNGFLVVNILYFHDQTRPDGIVWPLEERNSVIDSWQASGTFNLEWWRSFNDRRVRLGIFHGYFSDRKNICIVSIKEFFRDRSQLNQTFHREWTSRTEKPADKRNPTESPVGQQRKVYLLVSSDETKLTKNSKETVKVTHAQFDFDFIFNFWPSNYFIYTT